MGARVLVDEVYLDTVFEDPPGSCVHLGQSFVATGSLTKAYGLSGLRCGWIIADAEFARRVWRMQDLYGNVQPFAMDLLFGGRVLVPGTVNVATYVHALDQALFPVSEAEAKSTPTLH